ncbi:MAG: hypothetical protein K0S47_4681 [Herbinix sp.]|jgi:hypothetical protein|nr:hypothetical protein [Herbinix sp.]MDF2844650.1 hypothetical protein [Herbinix sp.]
MKEGSLILGCLPSCSCFVYSHIYLIMKVKVYSLYKSDRIKLVSFPDVGGIYNEQDIKIRNKKIDT